MTCIKHKDRRTHAQALCSNNVKAHKRACQNSQHINTHTELHAPKQLVSTVSSSEVSDSIVNNNNKNQVTSGKHGQKMDTLSVHSYPDLMVDNQIHNSEVSQGYNIPIKNRFQSLQVDKEVQVSTDVTTKKRPPVVHKVHSCTKLQG